MTMAKHVEFIGAPGVGKTTIYQVLQHKWTKRSTWIPDKYLFPREAPLNFYSRILMRLGIRKAFNAKIDALKLKEAGDRFVALYPDYINACWNNIYNRQKKHLNGLDLRFAKTTYLYQLIQKIQWIKEAQSSKLAVVDEGLVHTILNALYWSETAEDETKEIKNLLQLIPLPYAIISVETNFSENIRRLVERKKVMSMHKSLVIADLESIIEQNRAKRTLINEIIYDYNIPFLKIDSSQSPEISINEIIPFLERYS